MRQIVLDTETTGLNPRDGDRIVEIGCVELLNRRLTGRVLHHYINPERDSDPGALAVHGLTTDFLSQKPLFAAIADELCDFVADAEILIHNAPFDVAFLDEEFSRLSRGQFAAYCSGIVDTLQLAKELHPGKRNSLDALCDRYEVSNAHRTLHGALLDAELLAEVYLAMTRGQESLVIEVDTPRTGSRLDATQRGAAPMRVLRATDEEALAHESVLDGIEKEVRKTSVWRASTAATNDSTTG